MALEPKSFFVGLTDVFTILLPGAIPVFAAASAFPAQAQAIAGPFKSELAQIGLFAMASYVVGHFVFIGGSKLDDWFYEPLNLRTPSGLMSSAASGKLKRLPPAWLQKAACWLIGKEKKRHECMRMVKLLRNDKLGPMGVQEPVNAFQWAKAWLTHKESAGNMAEVDRHEADSKFFRSFCVVIMVLIGLAAFKFGLVSWSFGGAVLIGLVIGLLSLKRYIELRTKAIEHAYRSVLVQEADAGNSLMKRTKVKQPIRAGGVVFRGDDVREFLLVSASDNIDKRLGKPDELKPDAGTIWVLPKGKVELGESASEAAVREIAEEAGILACKCRKLGDFTYEMPAEAGTASPPEQRICRYFEMEFVGKYGIAEPDRFVRWFSYKAVAELNLADDIRKVIDAAQA